MIIQKVVVLKQKNSHSSFTLMSHTVELTEESKSYFQKL